MAIKYFISREGDTEQWYFEWLQKAINSDPRTIDKIEFKFLNVTPSSFTKSNREAQKLFPKFNFYVGYSNYTFEVWMISHKAQVRTEVDRKNYYKQINRAYNKTFLNNDDYKHEKNFKSLLDMLSLDEVINNAIPECVRMRNYNNMDNRKLKRSEYNFDYFLCNPDTSLHKFVENILSNAGII